MSASTQAEKNSSNSRGSKEQELAICKGRGKGKCHILNKGCDSTNMVRPSDSQASLDNRGLSEKCVLRNFVFV